MYLPDAALGKAGKNVYRTFKFTDMITNDNSANEFECKNWDALIYSKIGKLFIYCT